MWDAMIDMYEKYGYYLDSVKSVTLAGIEGQAQIQKILETLRAEAPTTIGFLSGTLRKRLQDRRHQEPRHRRRDRNRTADF